MNKLKELREWLVALAIVAVVILAIVAYGVYVLLALTFLLSVGGVAVIVSGFIDMGRGFSSLFQRSLATLKRERGRDDED